MAVRPTESEKALRYISQLDAARCSSHWDQIPELTRKIVKHAPQRKCLVLTAQTEAQVAAYLPRERPPTAGTSTSGSGGSMLAKLIPPLLSAIEAEDTHLEDSFQAVVCLGWIHWVLGEPQLAIAQLPKDVMAEFLRITKGPYQSKDWVDVCMIKAIYIKGFSQEKTIGPQDGLDSYKTVSPFLASLDLTLGSYNREFRTWTERLLSRIVAVAMKAKPLGEWLDLEEMLRTFHLWVSLFKFTPTHPKTGVSYEPTRQAPSMVELGAEVDYSRWDVWMAYYKTLSETLSRGYIYAPSYTDRKPQLVYSGVGLSDIDFVDCRLRQRTELKLVESSIETKLMEETRFPKATERNSRVERWVDAVMHNWRILCGPTWSDAELGEGGKNAIARGVLDILYRAATKTFHSTQILRYLFDVHAYVTEFDLAFRAFDSYLELVRKGKDREEKTGDPDYSLDDDDTTLHTVSEAIRILCRFGDCKDAEKARDIAKKLQDWTQKACAEAEAQENLDSEARVPVRIPVSPSTVAEAYRAVGICEAAWSRLTYDASTRSNHQQKATESFRKSLQISMDHGTDLETSYQLALVLAEMRELAAAIKVVKQAMARSPKTDFLGPIVSAPGESIQRSEGSDWERERKLIPFWHLLTLLLTAKADMTTAARTSNAAFEQFDDSANLFGPDAQFKNEHLQELEQPRPMPIKGLVDRMACSEKESIIQIKLTQIAIKEVVHGSTEAVDSSAELLALYARLFGDPRTELEPQNRLASNKTPRSAVGSLRHSVFGRIGRSRSKARRDPNKSSSVPSLPTSLDGGNRPPTFATSTTVAPTIHITNEDGSAPQPKRSAGAGGLSHHGVFHRRAQHSDAEATPRNVSSKLSKRSKSQSGRSLESSRPGSSHTTKTNNGVTEENEQHATNASPRSATKSPNFSLPRPPTQQSERANGPQSEQPLRPIPHNLNPISQPPPPGHKDNPPKQDQRLPAPHPASGMISPRPTFPEIQEKRHRTSLLVELWLFIAGLYTRASVYDDAKAALDEAAELVQAVELEVAAETSSAKAFAARGWGGSKSIEELWADCWAAHGDLDLAQGLSYDAMTHYEKALSHYPDHPSAVVGLSDLLLDIAGQKLPPEAPERPIFEEFRTGSAIIARDGMRAHPYLSEPVKEDASSAPTLKRQETTTSFVSVKTSASQKTSRSGKRLSPSAVLEEEDGEEVEPSQDVVVKRTLKEPSPQELNRLAARDRAYGLLSSLTKLGSGWDYSEAWSALARSYELSGQVEKAKEVLWWCVELEDTRPVRSWSCLGPDMF